MWTFGPATLPVAAASASAAAAMTNTVITTSAVIAVATVAVATVAAAAAAVVVYPSTLTEIPIYKLTKLINILELSLLEYYSIKYIIDHITNGETSSMLLEFC